MANKSEIKKLLTPIIIGVSIILALVFYFKSQHIFFTPDKLYHARYDNTSGITENSPVQIKGLNVGAVYKINIEENNPSNIVISFTLNDQRIKLPLGSTVKINSFDILGDKVLSIILKDTNAYHIAGDTLIGISEINIEKSVDNALTPIKIKTDNLKLTYDSAASIIRSLKEDAKRQKLLASFEGIERAMETMNHLSAEFESISKEEKWKINSIEASINSITNNLDQNDSIIDIILCNYEYITDSISIELIEKMSASADIASTQFSEITEKINSGEGSIGLLLSDTSLSSNLDRADKDFQLLLLDFDKHPERYIRVSLFPKKRKKGAYQMFTEEQRESLKRILEGKKNGDQ